MESNDVENPMSNLWKRSRIQVLLRKLCLELPYTFKPTSIYRFLATGENALRASQLTQLLCLASRVAPYIPDSAVVGAYSNATSAMVYKKAAEQMPRLIVIGMFGEDAVAKNLQYFLSQLEKAESELSKEELSVAETIMGKDRGPLLYWLLNTATCSQRKDFAEILTRMLGSARGHEISKRMAGKDFGFDTGVALQSAFQSLLSASSSDAELRHVFDSIDTDGSGEIDQFELVFALGKTDKSKAEVDAILEGFGDSKMNFEAFKALIRKPEAETSSKMGIESC